jgi:hypothetical protein
MIIIGQFGFNCPSGFREEAFWNIFPIANAFFSETTNMIKAKLYMNVHWVVFYKFDVFCSDMKFKMAATAGFSLTLDLSYREKRPKVCREPSNEHSCTV